jgi:hypothetical protein
VPEVVDHGAIGFVVDHEQEGLQAIKRLPELDPSRVRAEFERRFTARHMVEDFVPQLPLAARKPVRLCDLDFATRTFSAHTLASGAVSSRADRFAHHAPRLGA